MNILKKISHKLVIIALALATIVGSSQLNAMDYIPHWAEGPTVNDLREGSKKIDFQIYLLLSAAQDPAFSLPREVALSIAKKARCITSFLSNIGFIADNGSMLYRSIDNLMASCSPGLSSDLVKMYLKGARRSVLDIKGYGHETAIEGAILAGNVKQVKVILLAAGNDVVTLNSLNRTLLHSTVEKIISNRHPMSEEIFNELLYALNVHVQNYSECSQEVLNVLKARDGNGKTACDIADGAKLKHVVKMLKNVKIDAKKHTKKDSMLRKIKKKLA